MYEIEFALSIKNQLKFFSKSERTIIFKQIEIQLMYEPLLATRNRKLLRPNPLAPWELRIGDIRVFYEVAENESDIVRILAIGKKVGNKVIIGGKEINL